MTYHISRQRTIKGMLKQSILTLILAGRCPGVVEIGARNCLLGDVAQVRDILALVINNDLDHGEGSVGQNKSRKSSPPV